jgi:hypothetical protein
MTVLDEVAEQCDHDPVRFVDMLAEITHALPAQARGLMAAEQMRSGNTVAREAAVLLLLDPDPEVRQATAAILQASIASLSPDSLRRLIAMRNWLPQSERHRVDGIVRAARAKAIDCAAWPRQQQGATMASGIDGSGAQSLLAVSKAGSRKRVSMILLKTGVREALSGPPQNRRKTRSVLDYSAAETSMSRVSRIYFNRVVRHHLAFGLAAGRLPPPGLLEVAELIGAVDWQPELLEWRSLLADMARQLPAALRKKAAVHAVLRTSGEWGNFDPIAETWFEDDPEVARLVHGCRGRRKKTAEYVLQSVLRRRREKWAEHFLWTALWLREAQDAPWPQFAMLARALADGHDLAEIPLMREIAARTVTVLAEASP